MEDAEANNIQELETFVKNISVGFVFSVLYRNEEIISIADDLLKTLLQSIFADDFLDTVPILREAIRKMAIYNLVILQSDQHNVPAILSLFRHQKKKLESIEEYSSVDRKSLSTITLINKKFGNAYQTSMRAENYLLEAIKKKRQILKDSIEKLENITVREPEISPDVPIHVFISHTTNDKPIARRISKELEETGIVTWLDEKDIIGGQSIPEEITKGLEDCTHFTVIYSNNSKDKPWVKTELNSIIMRRNANPERLPLIIPLLMDGLMPPRLISEIKGIDFDNFNHGISELYKVFGVKNGRILSLTDAFLFMRKLDLLIDTLEWCLQADSFLNLNDESFWNLVECEEFINHYKITSGFNKTVHFVFNGLSYSQGEANVYFDDDFYTYMNAGRLALHVVVKYLEVIERIMKPLGDT